MEKTLTPLEFWSQVWDEGTIRFHQNSYNSEMIKYFKDINLQGKSVLIPLAGKTKDILYFLEKGAIVTAIEFWEPAVISFFEENNIPYKKHGYSFFADNLTFHAMDFFNFSTDKPFDVLFDRASQVVFNKTDRPRYYQYISKLIDPKTTLLLYSIDHNGPFEYGPPHKIPKAEIVTAYKKMGITLQTNSETHEETTSEKMQAQGILSLTAFTLVNIKS
jgi:thiopurine S-methyltransferase